MSAVDQTRDVPWKPKHNPWAIAIVVTLAAFMEILDTTIVNVALPHIAGITIGFAFMVGAVGAGLGTIFIAYPVLQTILKYAGAGYLVYLAAAIAMSGPPKPGEAGKGPMTFFGAAMFQWVNVKGWVMVIGTITAYAAIATYPWNITIQVALSLVLGALSCTAWAMSGSSLRPILSSRRTVRTFNIVMAILLLASLIPVLLEA